MKNILLGLGLTAFFCWNASASDAGDAFIRFGQKVNQSSLSDSQIQSLFNKLDEAQSILSGSTGGSGFVCLQGTVYGPNNQSIWTGDSGACENSDKVYVHGDYACVTGTLYGSKGLLKWTGDSSACGNSIKVKIGTHYACADGTIYGPAGFEKWTGDSNYCQKATLD